jgi:hypothetical protein
LLLKDQKAKPAGNSIVSETGITKKQLLSKQAQFTNKMTACQSIGFLPAG